MSKKKKISMVVTVSVPAWLTAAQARKEVRFLIKEQTFWGHIKDMGWQGCEVIGEDNFKVVEIVSPSKFVGRP